MSKLLKIGLLRYILLSEGYLCSESIARNCWHAITTCVRRRTLECRCMSRLGQRPQRLNKLRYLETIVCVAGMLISSTVHYLPYLVILAELRADLFSRHASPLEVCCVFVAVDERGEDVMSDDICRRCNGKKQRRRGGRIVQLPDWFMNKIKSQHIIAYTWLSHFRKGNLWTSSN